MTGLFQRLRGRKEWKFFAALPKADRRARGRLVGDRAAARNRCRCCSRSRWACSSPRCSAATALAAPLAHRRRHVRPAAGADADPDRGQPQPRRSHGGVALRPADRGVRPPAGHRAPRGSGAGGRPHRRARLRSRHDRSAVLVLDGLHRRRAGRDDRRPRVRRGRARSALRGGRRSCSPARGSRRTGCCARAASGRIATPTEVRARSATPTTPIASPSIRRQARSCGCSGWSAGRSNDSSRGARGSTSSSTRRRDCARRRSRGAC